VTARSTGASGKVPSPDLDEHWTRHATRDQQLPSASPAEADTAQQVARRIPPSGSVAGPVDFLSTSLTPALNARWTKEPQSYDSGWEEMARRTRGGRARPAAEHGRAPPDPSTR
jgi:hypothetical protein